jgi:hypothetical protein
LLVADSFDRIIQEHLDLKRRNSSLESELPLSDYIDPQNSPQPDGVFDGAAFDTDTASSSQQTEAKEQQPKRRSKAETFLESLEDVWSGPQSFDWGDKTS